MSFFKNLLFLSLALLLSCANDKNKPVEVLQNYGTGEVSRRYFTINGKKEGKMLDYYPDGKLKAERLFENDKQTGRTIIFYQNGNTKETQHYAEGEKHGGDTLYHENGKPQTAIQFNMGKKDGYVRTWDLDGALIFEAKYMQDSLVEVEGESVENKKTNQQATNSDGTKPKSPTAEGPTGYISRTNTSLVKEPTATAAKTIALKQYEEVIILETKMTDEAGKEQDVPQWYKVQTKNGKVGWVIAKNLSVN